MKNSDKLRLVFREYRFGCLENIISVGLQALIFTIVILLFTVSFELDDVLSGYMNPMYSQGYGFDLFGYSQDDIPELEKQGFRDIEFYEDGDAYGYRDNLSDIWFIKILAIMDGKDIWNSELDEIVNYIFFGQITFLALGVVMFIIMLNNISNSISMRLMLREKYLRMMSGLGCRKSILRSIFFMVFAFRSILAILVAVAAVAVCVDKINAYLHRIMLISLGFSCFSPAYIIGIGLISIVLIFFTFERQWRARA